MEKKENEQARKADRIATVVLWLVGVVGIGLFYYCNYPFVYRILGIEYVSDTDSVCIYKNRVDARALTPDSVSVERNGVLANENTRTNSSSSYSYDEYYDYEHENALFSGTMTNLRHIFS